MNPVEVYFKYKDDPFFHPGREGSIKLAKVCCLMACGNLMYDLHNFKPNYNDSWLGSAEDSEWASQQSDCLKDTLETSLRLQKNTMPSTDPATEEIVIHLFPPITSKEGKKIDAITLAMHPGATGR